MFTAFFRLQTLLAIWWLRFRQERLTTGHKEPTSFIIFRLDSMGDVVLTTPLFRALKASNPQSRSTVVVQPAYRSLLLTNPYVDEVPSMPQPKHPCIGQRFARVTSTLRSLPDGTQTNTWQHCFVSSQMLRNASATPVRLLA